MRLPEFRILCLFSGSLVIIPVRTLLKIVTNFRFSVKGEKHFMVAERLSTSYRRILLRNVNDVTARGQQISSIRWRLIVFGALCVIFASSHTGP